MLEKTTIRTQGRLGLTYSLKPRLPIDVTGLLGTTGDDDTASGYWIIKYNIDSQGISGMTLAPN